MSCKRCGSQLCIRVITIDASGALILGDAIERLERRGIHRLHLRHPRRPPPGAARPGRNRPARRGRARVRHHPRGHRRRPRPPAPSWNADRQPRSTRLHRRPPTRESATDRPIGAVVLPIHRETAAFQRARITRGNTTSGSGSRLRGSGRTVTVAGLVSCRPLLTVPGRQHRVPRHEAVRPPVQPGSSSSASPRHRHPAPCTRTDRSQSMKPTQHHIQSKFS
jgi:hypothetical protein